MPARYELTSAAKEDVRGIWLYTAAQWGEQQAEPVCQSAGGRLSEDCEQACHLPDVLRALPAGPGHAL
jgi:plasmid stabilization system protein ParE